MSEKRKQPISESIPPRDWKVSELNQKNKKPLMVMLDRYNIEYLASDTNDVLLELLKEYKKEDAKKHKNKLIRERAANKRKNKNKKKRGSANSRNKRDPISVRPLQLDANNFDMMFRESEIPPAPPAHSDDDAKAMDDDDAKAMEMSDFMLSASKAVPDGADDAAGAIDEAVNDDGQIEEETMEDALTRMGLKQRQILIILEQEFESIDDVLALSGVELMELGFKKMGARKAIARKLEEEKNRKCVVIEKGVVQGNNKNVMQQLLDALQGKESGNGANNNVKNENNIANNDNRWFKLGNKRRCYVGKLRRICILAYNSLAVGVTMKSLNCTDASKLRELVFRKTRNGDMDKVRCYYDEKSKRWPHSNIAVVQKVLNFLGTYKYVVIFEESYGGKEFGGSTGYSARFGRNPVSTALALQDSIDDVKKVWSWMKQVDTEVDWSRYVHLTHDEEAVRLRLVDFTVNEPDWDAFNEWKSSGPQLREAQDPDEE